MFQARVTESWGHTASSLLTPTFVDMLYLDSKSSSVVQPLAVDPHARKQPGPSKVSEICLCAWFRRVRLKLKTGIGVRCIIAKSFSYIFGRNAPNVGLLAITVDDPVFHEAVQHGACVRVDVMNRALHVANQTFSFDIGDAELGMIADGGLAGSMSKSQTGKSVEDASQVLAPHARKIRMKNSREDMEW